MSVSFVPPGTPARNILYGFMKIVVPCWCKCAYKIEVYGKHRIPGEGPAVIVPKHQYWTDIPLVGFAFYNIHLNYVAKEELFHLPLIKHFLLAMGGIPLDRGRPIKSLDSFKYITFLIQQKQYIVIFPEGTYYRGIVGRGKSRLIRMILKFQEVKKFPRPVPFIPVGVNYRKGKLRTDVKISIGEPLFAKGESEAKTFTQTIMEEIARLSNLKQVNRETSIHRS